MISALLKIYFKRTINVNMKQHKKQSKSLKAEFTKKVAFKKHLKLFMLIRLNHQCFNKRLNEHNISYYEISLVLGES